MTVPATKVDVNRGIVQLPVKRDPPVNVATAVLTEIPLGSTEVLDVDAKVDDVALTSKHRDISQS